MEFKRAIAEIRPRWKELIEGMLPPAKDKVNGEQSYICPFCAHGSNGDGLTFNPKSRDKNTLHCFTCSFTGDIIDLYEKMNGCTKSTAVKDLAERLNITLDELPERPPKTAQNKPSSRSNSNQNITTAPTTETPTQPIKSDYTAFYERCSRELDQPSAAQYLASRGISKGTAELFSIGYCGAWRSPTAERAGKHPPASERLIIPVTENYYIAVATDRKSTPSKYWKMNEGAAEIFNLEALYNDNNTDVFITEGIFDALSVIDIGYPAISLNSTSNTEKLIRQLKESPTAARLIISLDNDKAGREAADKLKAALDGMDIKYLLSDTTDIAGSYNDPNEHLQNDRISFIKACNRAVLTDKDRPDNTQTYLEVFIDGAIKNKPRAIPTGFNRLDKALNGGLYDGLIALGAISSLGKTTFSLQLAYQIAKSGKEVLYFSIEQSTLELVSKSLARLTAEQELDYIRFSEEHQSRAAVTALQISRGDISDPVIRAREQHIKDTGKRLSIIEWNFKGDINAIKEYIKQYIRDNKVTPVIFIDYLQIMQPPENIKGSTKELTDYTVKALKSLSRELKTTIIAISSLNRSNYLTPVDFESFKESGGIEYTADGIWGLELSCLKEDEIFNKDSKLKEKRETIKKAKDDTPRRITLQGLKNRGCKANFSIEFDYFSKFDLFVENNDYIDWDEMD